MTTTAAVSSRRYALTSDGSLVVIAKTVGDCALCFEARGPRDKPIDPQSAHDGVARLKAIPVAQLSLQEPLCLRSMDHILRALAVAEAREHAQLITEPPKAFEPGKSKIPPSGKVVGAPEAANLVQAGLDLWLTAGRFSDQFEDAIARRFDCLKSIAVNSGSSANLVALSALTSPKLGARALKAGDEVITAAAGFPTTVNPILQNGLIPVFVDSELETGNIDARLIEAAITPKTKAIMAAHTLGNPMDMREISRLAKKYNLWLIEDCCDAFGSTIDGQLCGTFGDLGTLSFYPAHHITMGEGGAVFGQDIELMKIVESFRDWGRDCYCPPGKDNTCNQRFCWKLGQLPQGYDHKYTYSHVGYNLKITDMQAAVGMAQLDRLEGFIERRRHNHKRLLDALAAYGVNEFAHLPQAQAGSDPSWFGFLITLRQSAPCSRNEMTAYLEQNGIGTRLLFAGNLTKQPYFDGKNYRVSGALPNADALMERAFWVGVWPGITDEQIDFMAKTIAIYLGLAWE